MKLLSRKIKYCLICYLILSCFFALFASEVSEELFLVIGSTRKDTTGTGEISSILRGNMNADCSHEDTFAGNATTFDLEMSDIPHLPHIVGDATDFDFSSYKIKKVFIERMYTSIGDSSTPGEHNNLIGKIIENISPHMVFGASLEIELDPCLNFLYGMPEGDEELKSFVLHNPFHAWYNLFPAYDALIDLKNKNYDKESLREELNKNNFYEEEIIERVLFLREKFSWWLNEFARRMEVKYQDLAYIIKQEMKIYNTLSVQRPSGGDALLVLLFEDHYNLSLEDLKSSLKFSKFEIIHPKKVDLVCTEAFSTYEVRDSEKLFYKNFWYYNLDSFFEPSFTNAFISSVAVDLNRDLIESYLLERGFENFSLEFGDSLYNGRKNQWTVRAFKK